MGIDFESSTSNTFFFGFGTQKEKEKRARLKAVFSWICGLEKKTKKKASRKDW
jgi:hypothetical protein